MADCEQDMSCLFLEPKATLDRRHDLNGGKVQGDGREEGVRNKIQNGAKVPDESKAVRVQ